MLQALYRRVMTEIQSTDEMFLDVRRKKSLQELFR